MSDWIGLAIIALVVAGAVAGLSYLGREPRRLSSEEYEERVQEARGTTRSAAAAGLQALQKFVNPKAAEAIQAIKDLKAGHYDDQQKQGEGGEGDGAGPGAARGGQQPTLKEGDDA